MEMRFSSTLSQPSPQPNALLAPAHANAGQGRGSIYKGDTMREKEKEREGERGRDKVGREPKRERKGIQESDWREGIGIKSLWRARCECVLVEEALWKRRDVGRRGRERQSSSDRGGLYVSKHTVELYHTHICTFTEHTDPVSDSNVHAYLHLNILYGEGNINANVNTCSTHCSLNAIICPLLYLSPGPRRICRRRLICKFLQILFN